MFQDRPENDGKDEEGGEEGEGMEVGEGQEEEAPKEEDSGKEQPGLDPQVTNSVSRQVLSETCGCDKTMTLLSSTICPVETTVSCPSPLLHTICFALSVTHDAFVQHCLGELLGVTIYRVLRDDVALPRNVTCIVLINTQKR